MLILDWEMHWHIKPLAIALYLTLSVCSLYAVYFIKNEVQVSQHILFTVTQLSQPPSILLKKPYDRMPKNVMDILSDEWQLDTGRIQDSLPKSSMVEAQYCLAVP